MTTREDLFRIHTRPSNAALGVQNAVRRWIARRQAAYRSRQAFKALGPRLRRDIGLERDWS